jgi:hypothetical protein
MSWKKRFFTLCGQELRYHKSEVCLKFITESTISCGMTNDAITITNTDGNSAAAIALTATAGGVT